MSKNINIKKMIQYQLNNNKDKNYRRGVIQTALMLGEISQPEFAQMKERIERDETYIDIKWDK